MEAPSGNPALLLFKMFIKSCKERAKMVFKEQNVKKASLKKAISFAISLLMIMYTCHSPVNAESFIRDQLPADIVEDIIPQETEDSLDTLDISGSLESVREMRFLQALNDIITNPGVPIKFNILKEEYRDFDFEFEIKNLPDSAEFKDGVFYWTPQEDSAGTYPVNFSLVGPNGEREEVLITFDILGFSSIKDFFSEDPRRSGGEGNNYEYQRETFIKDEPKEEKKAPSNDTRKGKSRSSEKDNNSSISGYTGPVSVPVTSGNSSPFSTSGNAIDVSTRWDIVGGNTIFKSNATAVPDPTTTGPSTSNTGNNNTNNNIGNNTEEPQIIITAAPTEPPDIPVLTDPGVSSFNGVFRVEWTHTTEGIATGIYELQQSRDPSFQSDVSFFFPTLPFEDLDSTSHPESGYYYYRVRAWTDLPENGGLASEFSNVVLIGIDYERDIDILGYPINGVFTEVPGDPGTVLSRPTDPDAYSNPVYGISLFALSV